ncbi:unnamed protein product [Rotaria sordida]|uniref:Uncharacterized protein n=1 Tax=Rotaria sordida TaxID=392033 RepID=A0A819IQA7_9BILA|nr:unnamed protein product [Rotaria sordida]
MTDLGRWMKTQLVELNIFESEASRTSAFHLRTAIITTRVYLLMLVLAITILITFTLLKNQTETVSVLNPAEVIYDDLYKKYPTTIQCPCKHISMHYQSFISISVRYHPICSSLFISDRWINILFNTNISFFYPIDFRSSATGQFQLLASLCSLALTSVSDAIDDFLSANFLTPDVFSRLQFDEQIRAQSSFVQISTANVFQNLLRLLRSTTYSNRLQTALQTSRSFLFELNDNNTASVYSWGPAFLDIRRKYCYCNLGATCFLPSTFYLPTAYAVPTYGVYRGTIRPMANVTGFVAGCYPIESVLRSTLECFFDSSCLNTVLQFFSLSINSTFHSLNHNQTRFHPQDPIERLVNELFVEDWTTIRSFSSYYAQCEPISCTYTFTRHNDVLFVITKLLGLYGGLTIALRLLVSHTIGWWRTRTNRPRRPTNVNTTSNVEQQIVTIKNPSKIVYENLFKKYPLTLKCPCNQIVIPYGSFISFSPEYHPVCSSLFISDEWIISTRGRTSIDIYPTVKFEESGPYFFNTLAALCSLTQSTLSNAWQIFNRSSLITVQALSYEELIDRSNATLQQFIRNTLAEFKRIRRLISTHSHSMFLADYNTKFSTSHVNNNDTFIEFSSLPMIIENCSCAINNECKKSIGLYSYYDEQLIFEIPNLFISCSIIQGVLESSLECFFSQSCLDIVQWYIISTESIEIPILNASNTRFLPGTPIGVLLDSLMIEQWGHHIQYDQYFNQCATKLCSYTFISHPNPLYVITILVSLFGGLSIAWRIILPIIVGIIRNRMRSKIFPTTNIQTNHPLRLIDHIQYVWESLKNKLLKFNVFENEATWNNEYHIRTEILDTRIYILCLGISIIILIIYTLLIIQTQSIIINNPSLIQFEHLQKNSKYSSTLNCPCQNISIEYKSFIKIKMDYHPFCSSDFILNSSIWLNQIYFSQATLIYSYIDYRLFIVSQFQWLISLCTLANETLFDELIRFYSNTFISKHLQSRENFEQQVNVTIVQFRISTPRTFLRILDTIRSIAQGNSIVSSTMSNWYFFALNRNVEGDSLWSQSRFYGENNNCSCATNAMCTSQATINGSIVPGFRVGCYALEALLQSTLECLYNITCINVLKNMYYFSNITFRSLDPLVSSSNVTVQTLINELMIVQWETNVNYDQYYLSCAPLQCNYSIHERVSLMYIVTTIIGLFGGLTVVLKIFVPISAKIVRKIRIYHRQQRTVMTMTTVEEQQQNNNN